MTPFEIELDRVHSIVVGTVTTEGVLLAGNAGLLRLIDTKGGPAVGMRIGHLFIQPDFRTLLRSTPNAKGEVYSGWLTFGDDNKSWTLKAFVWRENEQFRLLGEYDIGGMEELCESVVDLNNYYATAQFELAQANLRLRQAASVFLHSHNGIIVTDKDNLIADVNPAFSSITGYSRDEVIGTDPEILASTRHDKEVFTQMWEALRKNGFWEGEIWRRKKNGEEFAEWLTVSVVRDTSGELLQHIRIFSDITGQKKAEDQIHRLAFFDQLTGLPNRGLVLDRLKQAIALSARSNNYGSLLFLDLDDFKTLNDTLGHDMGDLLLKQVANRLQANVRAGDTVARLGGDEFLIMLPNQSEDRGEAAIQTEVVGEKIRAALGDPYLLGKHVYNSTPSIGATLFRGDGVTVEEILKQADLAMYKAKAAGGNALGFFDPGLESAVKDRALLEADLREAIREEQLFLEFQPQISAPNTVTGAEVLVRWQHPRRGLVMPGEFIPLAEETGIIRTLGDWVLRAACAQLAKWASQPEMASLSLSVNVSASQFRHAGFVQRVLAALERTKANPNRLMLELTEATMVKDVEDVVKKMQVLKAKGVSFSLDDFGTGYSSMAYLKRMPLKELKIDGSFVRDVLEDSNDAAIARTIVNLAKSLGIGVIAEGVETAGQKDFLNESGCNAYQGYFFSRPLSLEKFEEFARKCSDVPAHLSGVSTTPLS
jgi:diguanylate cyclase (GGDEF)-like protein/PAS domain S-box-containing protein